MGMNSLESPDLCSICFRRLQKNTQGLTGCPIHHWPDDMKPISVYEAIVQLRELSNDDEHMG